MTAAPLPAGTVTFLLTDVVGSTRRWEDDREAMSREVAALDAFVADAVSRHNGVVVKPRGEGDSHFCVFARATDGVAAAMALQQSLEGSALEVRAALHTGETELRDGDYYGPVVNRAARLRAIGHGGQLLLSNATAQVVAGQLPPSASLSDCGLHLLRDLTEPEHVFELRWPGGSDHPPLLSLTTARHNLPLQLTSFIGREDEVTEVCQLLQASRLVTLTGAGGSGKTRLALQAAAEVIDAFQEGVWMVDLASVNDPDAVASTFADALGVSLEVDASVAPRDALLRFVRDRDVLLIVDNCEHLIAESAEIVVALLKSGSGVKVLATSREALGVTGETIWLVPSLSPAAASQLFVERAALKRPGYLPDGEDVAHVAQICARLDGIPLAIELAAGKMGVLTPQQIAARLDDRFRLLTGGGRTALARQQTLQATIDWSHGLLTASEQRLLRRLSVFAGGFILEAAERVCALDDTDYVLDDLGELVAKSLVVADSGGHDARYRLLETVRQYATTKLLEADEIATIRDHHQSWFLEWCQRISPRLQSADEPEALADIESEIDNFRLAMAWDGGDPSARVVLAAALGTYWRRGHLAEGLEQLESALADCTDEIDPAARAAAFVTAALLAELLERGSVPAGTAARLAQSCLELEADLAGPARTAVALALSVLALSKEGEGRAAWEDLIQRARQEAVAAGATDYPMSLLLYRHAGLLLRSNDWREGEAVFEESAAASRRCGAPSALARTLREYGLQAFLHGEVDRASELWLEAEELARSVGDTARLAELIRYRAAIYFSRHEAESGYAAMAESERLYAEIGIKVSAGVYDWLGYVALTRDDFDVAAALFDRAIEVARASDDGVLAHVMHSRAEAAVLSGDLDDGEERLRAVLRLLDEDESTPVPPPGAALPRPDVLRSLVGRDLGVVALSRGDHRSAARLLAGALADFRWPTDSGWPRAVAIVIELAVEAGRPEDAARLAAALSTAAESSPDALWFNYAGVVRSVGRGHAASPSAFDAAASDPDDAASLAQRICEDIAAGA